MPDLSNRTQYGRLASLYDWCADVGSLGAIPFVKKLHILEVPPGASILYVGGGTCEEAMIAAARGHSVTILDSSDKMLSMADSKARRAGAESRVTLIHDDFLKFSSSATYDAIALHFFLDIFDLPTVHQVLAKAISLLASDGQIFVADFAPPSGTIFARSAQWLYQQGGALACALLASQPWLRIEDYALACSEAGLTLEKTQHVGLRWLGRSWYVFILARPKCGIGMRQEEI